MEAVGKRVLEEHYTLGTTLTTGVCLATRKSDGKEFCVRTMKHDTDIVHQLRVATQYLIALPPHPHIIQYLDMFEDDTAIHVITESLVGGSELFELIVERGILTEGEAIDFVQQLATVVEYLHRNGIAHRDIKPENFFVFEIGDKSTVKLCGENAQALNQACGTPGYVGERLSPPVFVDVWGPRCLSIAPEVLEELLYECSVDMWSVGVITYILLCGFPPFYGNTPPELFQRILAVDYSFDDTVWGDVSFCAKEFVTRLLVREPSKRSTAKECLQHPWLNKSNRLGQ